MATKYLKSIGLSRKTKRVLTMQALDLDIDLKLHCEDILEKAAGTYVGKKKYKKKAKKVVVSKGDVGVIDVEKMAEKAENDRKKGEKNAKKIKFNFKKSGVFRLVEDGIYTNGHCFEVRKWSALKSRVVYSYFPTLEDAKLNKKN